jgi:CPA1 family monovalent cation:H+ antiporter
MPTDRAVDFLLWLLIAASIIAVIAQRLRIPYTVALVLGGLALGSARLHLPVLVALSQQQRPDWLRPDIMLILFLPPLLFEGSIKIPLRQLRENAIPIALLANAGVLIATLTTGFAVHWGTGYPLLVALVFGSIVAATDPISVLAIFRGMAVSRRLSVIVEAESLLNDGTAAVLFQVLLAGVISQQMSLAIGIERFLESVLVGATTGIALGYLAGKITARLDEPHLEITLTTIVAYGSYLVADSLRGSGIIATVAAGLMVGNFGASRGMSARTRVAVWSFWEYTAFVINSILFLLIGMQVRLGDLIRTWRTLLMAAAAVLLGRVLSVYPLTPISNLIAPRVPQRWQHVLVWGGLRGSLSLALALSLPPTFPYRGDILNWTFGVVALSIIVQGLTIKPLLRLLRMSIISRDEEYDRARVQQIAASAAREELDQMLQQHLISTPAYNQLRINLDSRVAEAEGKLAQIFVVDESIAAGELDMARIRLLSAERDSIQRSVHDGLVSAQTAASMIDAAERELSEIIRRNGHEPR